MDLPSSNLPRRTQGPRKTCSPKGSATPEKLLSLPPLPTPTVGYETAGTKAIHQTQRPKGLRLSVYRNADRTDCTILDARAQTRDH